ncbi:lamin tail domain-containing protein [Haloarchaeobius amylolyticus]|uniref:lamin tail domain-containing protein n=1 Tax=Haloarchaeobius amylolyticus TaxID=1198296 RepID=UPI00226E31EA|nr:lamin tail domain-containing protein [Haloarchaeobius amylolyticus]
MRRRDFLTSLTVAAAGTALGTSATSAARAATGTIDSLEFDSTASLLDSSGNVLTDDSLVAVKAETSAVNDDADGNGDAVAYPYDTDIPLVAVDESSAGTVVGFGATLVSDDANFRSDNEEFVLNVFDAYLGGSGTILYDEGHDAYHTLTDFSNMANYAETQQDYAVSATSDISADLAGADAVWLTGPSTAYTSTEKQDLADFVAGGGDVFIFDRADYSNYDETANLNDIASALSLSFRFNDDQVTDDTNNGGVYYKPTTTRFDTTFDFFADRPGMEIDPNATHTVDVVGVSDGDTATVRFDSGREENVRILGMDTPEKEQYQQYERTQEWEGIESMTYLADWGANATTWGENELGGKTIDLSFDDNEPGIFDQYDRLLGYIHYDATGDGTRDDFYNLRTVQNGYARVYASGFSNYETFYDAEVTAQQNGTNLWSQSDPSATDPIRNRTVDDQFFPDAASVRTSSGAISQSRVPVLAESEATQTDSPSVSYTDIPLVGVDEAANVAMVGSPFIDESFEQAEGYAVDTSTYENFTFLTNLLDWLSDSSGKVVIDGGHGQFSADYALSSEDVAYYQRYLEGVGIDFDQVNNLTSDNLSNARALVVTSPADSFTTSETDAVSQFVADGGSVVLVGAASATSTARSNLNTLAADLGSDLRLNDGQVEDATNNVNSDAAVPVSTRFDTSFPLFSAFDGSNTGGSGTLELVKVHADAEGTESENLNDEYVVFENTGSGSMELTNYVVEDAAGKSYTVPEFSLDAGARVTLHTGSGTDSATDLYWNRSSAVWNNSGDTVIVTDDSGTEVINRTYSGDGFDETDDGSTSDSIVVKNVHEDAEGTDSENLNDEYVVFENTGSSAVDMTDYVCEDEAAHDYVFPSFTLDAGATVTLHTGSGTDTSTDLYWGSGSSIWNNAGDTVYLFDASGNTVLTHSY